MARGSYHGQQAGGCGSKHCTRTLASSWRLASGVVALRYAIGKGERVIADGVMPSEVFEAVLPKDTPTPPQSHYGELADAAEKARRKRLGIR